MSAWLLAASPLVQIYQSLSMAEGEASCAPEWAAFVQNNISTPAVANVTAGEPSLYVPPDLNPLPSCALSGFQKPKNAQKTHAIEKDHVNTSGFRMAP